ncbi:MAG: hypothetical protein ACYCXW_03160 [Solirubrobacteraceae bacterium]
MYHVELRQFPHVARMFNLSSAELDARFVKPWVAGAMIDCDDRRWSPERSRLTVLEGRELRPEELGLGRGWATAAKSCEDVTAAVIAAARRGEQARPEVEALKAAVEEVATGTISFSDVVALAAAAQPTWRASEQLALAEQAVWEMLHQGRVEIVAQDGPVARERWQGIVLSWASWAGESALRLRR